MKNKITAAIVALGMMIGIGVPVASATIGPFGGRTLTAYSPHKDAGLIWYEFSLIGNGGQQTVDNRLRRFENGQWFIVATNQQTYAAGNYTAQTGYGAGAVPCPKAGTYTYQSQAKWASYAWSQADSAPGVNITCP